MPVKITISIENDTADAIAAAFDRKDRDEACRLFAALATDHFHGWISGSQRYRTLSEQYTAWIEDLYDRLLDPTEAPSVHRLYNSFNMAYGQATYIARVLSEKSLKQWRTQALVELASDIELIWPTANGHLTKNEKTRQVTLRTSRLSAIELARICDEVWRTDKGFAAPTAKGGSGEQRVFEMSAESVKIVRAKLKAAK
jgi:hypothetical protein